MVAKTTQSVFADVHHDEFRALADTTDRSLATSMSASWAYAPGPRARETSNFITAREAIHSALLATFINHYSRSVQETLYKMAQAALAATDAIDSITFPPRKSNERAHGQVIQILRRPDRAAMGHGRRVWFKAATDANYINSPPARVGLKRLQGQVRHWVRRGPYSLSVAFSSLSRKALTWLICVSTAFFNSPT